MKKNKDDFEYSFVPRSTKSYVNDILNEYAAEDDYINRVDERQEREPEFADAIINLGMTDEISKGIKSKFCDSIKPALLSLSIQKVMNKCFSTNVSESAKAVAKNLINNMIEEVGCGDMLYNFRHNSLLLSEYAQVIDSYYDRIINESIDDDDEESDGPVDYYIDPDTREDFFKDIANIDDDEVVMAIRNRVSDAIAQFINKNTEQKLEIKDVLDSTLDKVSNIQTNAEIDEEEEDNPEGEEAMEDEPAYEESANIELKRKINRIKESKVSTVFEKMVYNMTERVIKNDYMHEEYMKNNRPNMDAIVESCEVLYTFLEMVNTSKMMKVDENTIIDIINEK